MTTRSKRPSKSGSLTERSSGVWLLRIGLGKDPISGKYLQSSKVFKGNKTQAERELTKLKNEAEERKSVASKKAYGYVLDKWLEDRRREGLAANTLKGYEQQAKVVKEELGSVPLHELSREQVKAFYNQLQDNGLSTSRIRSYRAVITGSLNHAVDEKWIPSSPANGVKVPKLVKAKLTVPTPEQVFELQRAALEHAAKEWHYFLPLAVASWCRRGELTALQWDHVDFANQTLFIEWAVEVSKGRPALKPPKGRKNRRLAMDFESMKALAQFRQWQIDNWPDHDVSAGFVFPSPRNQSEPTHPDTFTNWFEQTRDLAEVKRVRLHDIRHYGPTQALSRGEPLPLVSYRLGHAQISTTLNTYIDWIPERDRDLADFMGELMAPPAELQRGK